MDQFKVNCCFEKPDYLGLVGHLYILLEIAMSHHGIRQNSRHYIKFLPLSMDNSRNLEVQGESLFTCR